MKNLNSTIPPNKGFTLVEMAIVLLIVGMLLGGLLPTISSQIEQQHRNDTRKYMDEVRDALLGYAIAKKHLPCPDTTIPPDGIAEPTCTTASQVGTLPYKDLGVTDKDAYGNVLVYAVTKEFAGDTSGTTPFTLSTTGKMSICATQACSASAKLTSSAAAVIVARGANWANTPTADEAESIDTDDTNFVSHDYVQNGFDDMVIWVSPNILFNRMVTAGQLP